MSDAEEAYRNDPTFRRMVDVIHGALREAQLTPSEVRGAATLACIHYEQVSSRRLFVPAVPEESKP